ncbi:hypothetical protein BLNAU_1538 [Blattamonas nauphoetae]|uniref:TmcB/TmcC TPR repeats domain-containing protein n=1 Tax=Blattamonas nauphoetae TaxID=2049346 RepID=A0ABQ9YID5_9EUKA|nr:hypothetical protein BLNAU_1538 [Blattamonas nauphoetae]
MNDDKRSVMTTGSASLLDGANIEPSSKRESFNNNMMYPAFYQPRKPKPYLYWVTWAICTLEFWALAWHNADYVNRFPSAYWCLHLFRNSPRHGGPFACSSGQFNALQIILVFGLVFGQRLLTDWAFWRAVVSIATTLFILAIILIQQPYYSQSSNSLVVVSYSVFLSLRFFHEICLIVIHYTGLQWLNYVFFGVGILGGAGISFLLIRMLDKQRQKAWILKKNDEGIYQPLVDLSQDNSDQLEQSLPVLKEAWQIEVATRFVVLDQFRTEEMIQYVDYFYQISIRRMRTKKKPQLAETELNYALFLQFVRKNTVKASMLIKQARMNHPSAVLKFILHALNKDLSKWNRRKDFNDIGGRGNDADNLSFKAMLSKAQELHENARYAQIDFFENLSLHKPNYSLVNKHVEEIVSAEKKAQVAYKELLASYPQNTAVLRSYGEMMRDVFRDEDTADYVFGKADEMEEDSTYSEHSDSNSAVDHESTQHSHTQQRKKKKKKKKTGENTADAQIQQLSNSSSARSGLLLYIIIDLIVVVLMSSGYIANHVIMSNGMTTNSESLSRLALTSSLLVSEVNLANYIALSLTHGIEWNYAREDTQINQTISLFDAQTNILSEAENLEKLLKEQLDSGTDMTVWEAADIPVYSVEFDAATNISTPPVVTRKSFVAASLEISRTCREVALLEDPKTEMSGFYERMLSIPLNVLQPVLSKGSSILAHHFTDYRSSESFTRTLYVILSCISFWVGGLLYILMNNRHMRLQRHDRKDIMKEVVEIPKTKFKSMIRALEGTEEEDNQNSTNDGTGDFAEEAADLNLDDDDDADDNGKQDGEEESEYTDATESQEADNQSQSFTTNNFSLMPQQYELISPSNLMAPMNAPNGGMFNPNMQNFGGLQGFPGMPGQTTSIITPEPKSKKKRKKDKKAERRNEEGDVEMTETQVIEEEVKADEEPKKKRRRRKKKQTDETDDQPALVWLNGPYKEKTTEDEEETGESRFLVRNAIDDAEWEEKMEKEVTVIRNTYHNFHTTNRRLGCLVWTAGFPLISAWICEFVIPVLYNRYLLSFDDAVFFSSLRNTQFPVLIFLAQRLVYPTEFMQLPTVIQFNDSTHPVWTDTSHLSTDKATLRSLLVGVTTYFEAIHSVCHFGVEKENLATYPLLQLSEDAHLKIDTNVELLMTGTDCYMSNQSDCTTDRLVRVPENMTGFNSLLMKIVEYVVQLSLEDLSNIDDTNEYYQYLMSSYRFDVREGLNLMTTSLTQMAMANSETAKTISLITMLLAVIVCVIIFFAVMLPKAFVARAISKQNERFRDLITVDTSDEEEGLTQLMTTGVVSFDNKRSQILDSARTLNLSIKRGESKGSITVTFQDLVTLTANTFAEEEEMMKKEGFDQKDRTAHRMQHVLIRQRLTLLGDQLASRDEAIETSTMRQIAQLYGHHFSTEDVKLGSWIVEQRSASQQNSS